MSHRRGNVSRMTEEDMNEVIFKLQALLPADTSSRFNTRASASKVLKETCNYIKKLQKDVDGLSERLSQLLSSGDITHADSEIIRRLVQQ